MAVSQKMKDFNQNSSWIRKMFEEGARLKAEFGEDKVFDFSIGNPDVPPPPQFREAMMEIASENTPGQHGYMPNGGYTWVRQAIAARMSSEQEANVDQGNVIMTCGAAGGLNVVMKALLDPGDEVLLMTPYFVDYHFYADNHGGVTKVVRTDEQFNLDLDAIDQAITEKTKVLIINSPNNPSGQIYPYETIESLGRLLEDASKRFDSSIYLVSDEPYRKIVFEDYTVPPIFKLVRNSIVATSFSKDLSLPGERIGYVGVNPAAEAKREIVDAMTLATRILGFINAPAFMQRVVAGIQDAVIDNSIYARRRELFCSVLDEIGYQFVRPKGAFYLFPKTPIDDDVAFCSLLQKQKILAVPGRGFGVPGHIRLAFCIDEDYITRSAAGFKAAFEEAVSGC